MRDLPRRFWNAWKELASYVGDFQARLLLTVFYFTVAAPFAMIVRATDPLRVGKSARPPRWIPREARTDSLEAAKGQA